MNDRPLAYGSHPMHPHENACHVCGRAAVDIANRGGDCAGDPRAVVLQRAMVAQDGSHSRLLGWPR